MFHTPPAGVSGLLSSPDSMILQRELVILPQRIALPVVGEQDARQLGMAVEPYAGQVVDLALMPLGGAPDRRDRRNLWQRSRLAVLPSWQAHLHHEPQDVRLALNRE